MINTLTTARVLMVPRFAVIVTGQGLGSVGRVWLTFNGAIKTTVVTTNPEIAQLCVLLNDATMARQGKTEAAS